MSPKLFCSAPTDLRRAQNPFTCTQVAQQVCPCRRAQKHRSLPSFSLSVCHSLRLSLCQSVSLSDSVHINTPSQDIIYKQMQLSFLWRISGAGNCDDEILCESHKCRQTKPAQIESKREEFSERERERQGATLSLAGNRITLSV